MCVGDFNEISMESEKEEGRPKQPRMMEAFNMIMRDTNLVDMGYKGQQYTWCNNREGNQSIMERIDRDIVNTAWICKFPSYDRTKMEEHN